ncbi:hypothetical protein PGT21_024040 [Puccinia graminis f. sp. tritici]|uniref:Uncharacterized protein n=1 Tax=Puccinia graminis f. sp. tritici TaxID=56615 RepID=A0A5B0PFN3_PUCGR|nr:hypothetical protein PGT21_024040 [Puccinia graminis f. sp. tritici]
MADHSERMMITGKEAQPPLLDKHRLSLALPSQALAREKALPSCRGFGMEDIHRSSYLKPSIFLSAKDDPPQPSQFDICSDNNEGDHRST